MTDTDGSRSEKSKILAEEDNLHINLSNRKCRDMAYIRKFMGAANSSRFLRNKVQGKIVQGIRQGAV